MDILLRQARIIDPSSPFHQQLADIFIQNGVISSIGNFQHQADQVIDIPGLHVSTGWMDVFAHFCDPGYEFRETLETGAAAAAAGGFTDVMILPNTFPVLHNKSSIEYITQRSRSLPVDIHPIGAVTRNTEGKELAEMYDMERSGALAFSDGLVTIQSGGLLLKALQYLKAIKRTLIQIPDDKSVSATGLMHEGVISTQLGLPGRPAIAEELMVARDIELARYADSRLHLTGISSARSLELVRKAKAEGISVTCSVTPQHLVFIDKDLEDYDTNLKSIPPFREEKDREALRNAVREGLVDCISTHHMPHDVDHKVVEFENAEAGMIAMETAFSTLITALGGDRLEQLVEVLSRRPREVFGLPALSVAEGQEARLTLFDPAQHWTPGTFQSRSRNSPFAGKNLQGKVLGIINKDKLFLNQSL